jgi:FkbM family methyltransferase
MKTLTQLENRDRVLRDIEAALPPYGVRPAREGGTAGFVRDCHVDLLFRCPSPQELSEGIRSIDSATSREEYRYRLASRAAAEEACLNRPLVDKLRRELSAANGLSDCPACPVADLLRRAESGELTGGEIVRAAYETILQRTPSAEEFEGWTTLQRRGLTPAVLLWAVVYSEENLQSNGEPSGQQRLERIARRKAGYKELMLLSGNAFVELGCRMLLGRAAGEDDKAFFAKQLALDWPRTDALWRTIRRRQTAGRGGRGRCLWKALRRPGTWGRWYAYHFLHLHSVRRLLSLPNQLASCRQAIESSLAGLRQYQRPEGRTGASGATLRSSESIAADAAAISHVISSAAQRWDQLQSRMEGVCAAFQQECDRLGMRAESVRQAVRGQATQQEEIAEENRWQGQLVNDDVLLVPHPDGGIFGIPAENWGFVRMFAFAKGFEQGTMRVLSSLCRPDMVAIDVGAHVGLHAIVMSRRAGPQGRIHCFEPCLRTSNILRKNLFINGCENAVVHQIAVSDRQGPAKFFLFDQELTWSSMYPDRSRADVEAWTEVEVATARLDDAFAEKARVDVVKIDAEGAELDILRGMRRIIAENPQIRIVLEFGPSNILRTGNRPEELLQQIRDLGFSMRGIDEAHGELLPVSENELLSAYSVNLLLSKSNT